MDDGRPRALLSVVHPQSFPGSPPEDLLSTLSRIADGCGIDVLEVTTVPDPAMRAELRRRLHDASIGCVFLAGLPLLRAGASLSSDGPDRSRALKLAKCLIDEAAGIGARSFVVTSGWDPGPPGRRTARDRLVESLVILGEYAQGTGAPMTLRLEPTDREMHRRQVIGPTSEALEVVRAVGAHGLSVDLNMDVSHVLQLGEGLRASLAAAAPHCRHVHLSNCVLRDRSDPLFGDHHPPFGHPGSECDQTTLVRILRLLRDLGYLTRDDRTVLGVEVVPLAGADPWTTLDRALGDVRRAWMTAFGCDWAR